MILKPDPASPPASILPLIYVKRGSGPVRTAANGVTGEPCSESCSYESALGQTLAGPRSLCLAVCSEYAWQGGEGGHRGPEERIPRLGEAGGRTAGPQPESCPSPAEDPGGRGGGGDRPGCRFQRWLRCLLVMMRGGVRSPG